MTGEELRLSVVWPSHNLVPSGCLAQSCRHGAEKQTVPIAAAGVSSIQQADPQIQRLVPAGEKISTLRPAAMKIFPFSASTGEPSEPPPMRRRQISPPSGLR